MYAPKVLLDFEVGRKETEKSKDFLSIKEKVLTKKTFGQSTLL